MTSKEYLSNGQIPFTYFEFIFLQLQRLKISCKSIVVCLSYGRKKRMLFYLNAVCVTQTLPALILKIMRGSVTPIAEQYSDSLRQLIQDMLNLDPSKRPTIDQIIAQPFILNTLLTLYTDFGRIPCNRLLQLSLQLFQLLTSIDLLETNV